jgi:hypothetical protein
MQPARASTDEKRQASVAGDRVAHEPFSRAAEHRKSVGKRAPQPENRGPREASGLLAAPMLMGGGTALISSAGGAMGAFFPQRPSPSTTRTFEANTGDDQPSVLDEEADLDTENPLSEFGNILKQFELKPEDELKLFGLQGRDGLKTFEDWRSGKQPAPSSVEETVDNILSMDRRAFTLLKNHLKISFEELGAKVSAHMNDERWDESKVTNTPHRPTGTSLPPPLAARLQLIALENDWDLFGEAPQKELRVRVLKRTISDALGKSSSLSDLKRLTKIFKLRIGDIATFLVNTNIAWASINTQPLELDVLDSIVGDRKPEQRPPFTGVMLPTIYELLQTNPRDLADDLGLRTSTLAAAEKNPALVTFASALTTHLAQRGSTQLSGREFAEYVRKHQWTDERAAQELGSTPEMVAYARLLGSHNFVPGHLPLLIERYERRPAPPQ